MVYFYEAELCEASRSVARMVDWPCEVKTLFRQQNIGCKDAVSGAITWFFEHEEEGIILEDDCLAGESFFEFCEAMLEKYRDDERIMHISGNNFQHGIKRGEGSYYFSKYNHVWGWATWRRAWRSFDVTLSRYPEVVRSGYFHNMFKKAEEGRYWQHIFDKVYREIPTTWDYQWTFALWINHAMAVLPAVNLVSNIGFGGEATHTNKVNKNVSYLPTFPIGNIVDPVAFIIDEEADWYTFKKVFRAKLYQRIYMSIMRALRSDGKR